MIFFVLLVHYFDDQSQYQLIVHLIYIHLYHNPSLNLPLFPLVCFDLCYLLSLILVLHLIGYLYFPLGFVLW